MAQPDLDKNADSAVALKAVMAIADHWRLGNAEIACLLGGVPIPSLSRWKAQIREQGQVRTQLSRDQLDRVSHLLGIFKALHILFPQAESADGWVRRSNQAAGFDGRSALERMCDGGMVDLQFVHWYLESQLD